MTQKQQQISYGKQPPRAKAEIIELLALKQYIQDDDQMLYQPPITTETHHHFTEFNYSHLPTEKHHSKHNHRRLQSKNTSNNTFQPNTKTQSERIFKKHRTLHNSKRQTNRDFHNNSEMGRKTHTYLQKSARPLKNRFNSIQMHKKQKDAAITLLRQKAQTISHCKLIPKKISQLQSKYQNHQSHQSKLTAFLAKYKSHYHFQTKIRQSDLQHKHIEQIINEIKEAQEVHSTNNQEKIDEERKEKQINTNYQTSYKATVLRKTKNQEPVKRLLKERYQIIQKIGKGLSGEVFKCKDILSERLVAIKVISFQDKKESEYQFYKKVQHKNIINYLNNFTEKGKRYLVLQYLPFNLETLNRKRKFNQEEIKKIFRSIANALMFLHGLSIAHRDIKMENIVCSEDLTSVKFIDFGLCLDMNEGAQVSKQFCGTVNYMPPQILQKKPYDPKKADIWSLGILLYKLNFDRFPYRGKDERQLSYKIARSKLVFPEYCNEDLKHLLQKMLTKNPYQRPTMLQIIEHRWLL